MGTDAVAAKHSPQEADEWQADVGTLVAEFATKQACIVANCCKGHREQSAAFETSI